MIPTIVQRPKVFAVLEIQSGTLPAICCWLEVMEFRVLYLMPKSHSVKRHGEEVLRPRGGFHSVSDPVCIPTKGPSAAGFESIGNAFPAFC